jgi:hypothetical protein
MMKRKTLPAAILAFVMVTTAASAKVPEASDFAWSEIGAGSAKVIRERLIVKGYHFTEPRLRQQAIADLPDQVRRQRITRGGALRRAEKALQAVLELYDRAGTLEVVLYRSEVPQAMLFRGCILVLSDSLAGSLLKAELTGIIAHEVAHTYFMSELTEAREAQDKQAMKLVELKCDAIAVLSLVLLGFDSDNYISRLRKREKLANAVGLSGKFSPTHPEARVRNHFLARWMKQLSQ